MDKVVFDEIIKDQIARCENVLIQKGTEYATADKLHNFRVASALSDCTMEQALAGMMAKHTISIYDMVKITPVAHTIDIWDEKITDHINYLLLLAAVVRDKEIPSVAIRDIAKYDLMETLARMEDDLK